MRRTLGRWAIGAAAALLAGLAPATPALASGACGGSGAVATQTGTLPDGAAYEIQCPAGAWNGTLFLYSHGYVAPGSPNPAADVGDPATGAWMLGHGYALAGSSYASTGWAIQQALPDQIATLDVFDQAFGAPARTVAWGHNVFVVGGVVRPAPPAFLRYRPLPYLRPFGLAPGR